MLNHVSIRGPRYQSKKEREKDVCRSIFRYGHEKSLAERERERERERDRERERERERERQREREGGGGGGGEEERGGGEGKEERKNMHAETFSDMALRKKEREIKKERKVFSVVMRYAPTFQI